MYTHARNIVRRLVHCDLPLGTARLVLAVLSFVFSIVAGGLCLKIWTKHHTSEKVLNDNLPPGVSVVLGYEDVRTTSILLFVANHLVTFTNSHIAVIILHDIFKIIPPFVLRRIRLPQKPLSSVTLPSPAHPVRLFKERYSRGPPGELSAGTIQATLDRLGIALPYRGVHYIRISAEMPWPTVFFALSASVVTLIAWYRFRHAPAESVTEIVVREESSALGEESEKEKKIYITV
ncbi:hypothetical protein K438DRAFT_1965863 [Mycena galopus ATCC 62051]|nr:hypothetical protein K438DRAFT_1965863 [Mycena galopus ATCC 62051]